MSSLHLRLRHPLTWIFCACLAGCGSSQGTVEEQAAVGVVAAVPEPFRGHWAPVGERCGAARRMAIGPDAIAFDDARVGITRITAPAADAVDLTLPLTGARGDMRLDLTGAGSLMDVTAGGGRAIGYRRCLSKAKTGA